MSVSDNIKVSELIPQKEPFVLIDKLVDHQGKIVVSSFEIKEDGPLVENNFLQESGLLENMAQTCALLSGISAKKNHSEPVIGFIAGIKNFKVLKLPEVGSVLSTQIELTDEVMNMQIAKASIRLGKNEIIASCELKIFLKNNE
mgnify:CR=1 FL=1